jgi:glycosyltransferase involved in cell wall biosynthesis
MIKTSLVIPVHGGAQYFSQCLVSLESVESSSIELVFILDRIEEQVWLKLEKWLESCGLTYSIASSRNPGLPQALNVGLSASHGEYIARLDSDDCYIPGRISNQSKRLLSKPELVAVGGQMLMFSDTDKWQKSTMLPFADWQIRVEMRLMNPLAHPAMMYRRTALEKVGGYDEAVPFAQDYELATRLLKIGRIEALTDQLTLYRIHEGQISSAKWEERSKYVGQIIYTMNSKKLSLRHSRNIARQLNSATVGILSKIMSILPFVIRFPLVAMQIGASKLWTFLHFYLLRWRRP